MTSHVARIRCGAVAAFARVALLALVGGTAGCIGGPTDPADPAAAADSAGRIEFAERGAARRPRLAILPPRNEAPSAGAAVLAAPLGDLLVQRLDRLGRFEVVSTGETVAPTADLVLETAIADVRDRLDGEAVEYAGGAPVGRRWFAEVDVAYRVRRGDAMLLSGAVRGAAPRLDPTPARFPGPDDLATGRFWNAPYGLALRDALDRVLEQLDAAR